MTRLMIDCTHTNVAAVKRIFPNPPLVAVYLTGTPDIQWSAADRAQWPDSIQVTIDQGGPGSPVAQAMGRDVEPGAWTPSAAVDKSNWHTSRPFIYCDRADLGSVINAGWRGDVWLAWPGWVGTAKPSYPGINIVAIQNVFTAQYDESIVFDDTWPIAATKEAEVINLQVSPGKEAYVSFPKGSFKEVSVYRDFMSPTNTMDLRVAYHSQANGYVVTMVTIDSAVPKVTTFAHPDVDAVSIVNKSTGFDCGATIA